MPARQDPAAAVCTVSSDSHTWNLVFLQLLLQEESWQVENLGSCTPLDVIVQHCREHRPDLLVISSVNGHGLIEAPAVIEKIRGEQELTGMPIVLGGILNVEGAVSDDEVAALQDLGCDEVLVGNDAVDNFREYLRALRGSQQEGAA